MSESHYDLKKDDDFFVECLDSLLLEHEQEYVLIHNSHIVGFFKVRDDAVNEGKKRFKYGEYLVSKIENKEDAPKFVSFRYSFI